jgi:hypothetical protein
MHRDDTPGPPPLKVAQFRLCVSRALFFSDGKFHRIRDIVFHPVLKHPHHVEALVPVRALPSVLACVVFSECISFPPFFMETKKKPSQAEHEAGESASNMPLKTFLHDDVSASVFCREHTVRGGMQTFYSVSFSRSYKDTDGTRKYVKTFNPEDLGKVAIVAEQASAYIHALQSEMVAK